MIRREPVWHFVLDDALPADAVADACAAWPEPHWPGWVDYYEQRHSKRASNLSACLPPVIGDALRQMALLPWAEITGRPDLAYDLSLHGAGLHEMGPGSVVGPHLDADHHPRLGLSRALSVVLWVHREWRPECGGELELHDDEGPVVRVEPRPGRLVAFDSRGVHAVSPVLAGQRRSLSLWLYGPPGVRSRPRAHFLG